MLEKFKEEISWTTHEILSGGNFLKTVAWRAEEGGKITLKYMGVLEL